MIPEPQRAALFAAWLEEHRGIMHRTARAYAATPADHADLIQEMRLQLWRSLASFRSQASSSTWVYRVCLNTALTWRRGRSRRERHIEQKADIARVALEAPSPADQAGDEELLAELYAAIHALPMFDRALMLLALDGLAYREIAEITGLTENHVGVSLTRARQRLTEQLKGVTHELE